MTSDIADLVARLRHAMTTMANDDYSEVGSDKRKRHVARLDAMDKSATALEAIGRERDEAITGSDRLLVAQGTIHKVWELLGGQDPTRVDGQNLVVRTREVVSALSTANAEVERLTRERDEARRIIAACAGALPNGAFIDAERASLKFMASLPAEIAAVCAVLSLQQEDVSK